MLDTSLLSLVYRRSTGAQPSAVSAFIQLVEDDEELAVPSIVLQELLSGVRTERAFQTLDSALSGFLLLLPSRATHIRAAKLRSACARNGVTAGTVDCLIAAHAMDADATLFTLDADFNRIAACSDLRLLTVEPESP